MKKILKLNTKDHVQQTLLSKTPSDYFHNALYTNNPKKAEKLLVKIHDLGENNKTDRHEGELFNYYIKKENFNTTNQIIEDMKKNNHNKKYNSREGRINYLNQLLEKYKQINTANKHQSREEKTTS